MTTLAPSTPAAPLRPLVAGGAGYIGTLDKTSTAVRDALLGGKFVPEDLADRDALDTLFSNAPSTPWSRHKQVALKSMSVFTSNFQDFWGQGRKPGHDNFALPSKLPSNGLASAKAGLLIPATSKQTRITVTP